MPLTRRCALGSLAALSISACSASGTLPSRAPGVPDPARLTYGDHPSQFAELWLPAGLAPARGVVVVLHGGFWRQNYGLELGRPLAADLANAGVAALNVEYRRVGGDGGWPATLLDVAAAVDALADAAQRAAGGRLDLARVVAVGHSAGGQLAAWLAGRAGLPAELGGNPRVPLIGAVSQAGVLDLVGAVEQRLGGSAVQGLLGGSPDEVPDRYRNASPLARLPVGVPVLCLHGTRDALVPIGQSERYVAAATAAGDRAELHPLSGADHFAMIDPSTPEWARCREAVLRLLG